MPLLCNKPMERIPSGILVMECVHRLLTNQFWEDVDIAGDENMVLCIRISSELKTGI